MKIRGLSHKTRNKFRGEIHQRVFKTNEQTVKTQERYPDHLDFHSENPSSNDLWYYKQSVNLFQSNIARDCFD